MKRDLDALAHRRFDVLVIGGGIYGACIARDAALRGLSVALIEQADFCSGTSHNSLKTIHGGIRYLQHLDFRRVRESIVERRIWLSIAPHLIRPLRFVIPAQGRLARGPLGLEAALLLHRLLGLDWNRGVPAEATIPGGRVFGRAGLRREIPGLPLDGLTGAASWYDGQVTDSDRVVIECLQSAAGHGAAVANYVRAESLLQSQGRIRGVAAVDVAGHREFEIEAGMTVNAAGPWTQKIVERSLGRKAALGMPPLAKNMNIVTRQLIPSYAVGIPSRRPSDAVVGSESRLFFIVPWKNVSVIGTTHFAYDGDPDHYRVTGEDVADFVDEINESWPPARLTNDSVLYVYSGLTPAESGGAHGEVGTSKHAEIIDHGPHDGYDGLVSVIGVKYTSARLVAERAVTLVQKKLAFAGSARLSRTTPLPGSAGRIAGQEPALPSGERSDEVADLLGRYGDRPPRGAFESKAGFPEAFAACVEQAIDQEMALNLGDFLWRRNDFAARGKLSEAMVRQATETMGRALGWSDADAGNEQRRALLAVRHLCPD